jgi:hypothetical protein
MKNVLIGIGIAVILILLFLCFQYGKRIGTREVSKLKEVIDSINAIPPDTFIVRDTIKPDPEIRWRQGEAILVPTPIDTFGVNKYPDSLVTADLAIYVNDVIKGVILSRDIGYKLFVPQIITERVTVIEKVPTIVDRPVDSDGVLIGAGLGAGAGFGWSAGAGYKYQRSVFGVDYLRFQEQNYWLLSYKYLVFKW